MYSISRRKEVAIFSSLFLVFFIHLQDNRKKITSIIFMNILCFYIKYYDFDNKR